MTRDHPTDYYSGRRALWTCLIGAATLGAAAPTLLGDTGFDRAIEAATQRVVKLYGLGAGRETGYGTGVIVSPDGLVLTVSSLLIDAHTIRVVDFRGRQFEAEVVHRDQQRQLALLRMYLAGGGEGSERLPIDQPLPFVDLGLDLDVEAELRPGDWVIAAGNAFKVADGPEPVSIAHGIFSTRTRLDARRRVNDFPYRGDVLVIDAVTSNPGGPGSALVDLDGILVGMIGRSVTSNLTHTHFNYAIPRDVLQAFLREAMDPADKDGMVPRPKTPADAEAPDLGIRMAKLGYQRKLAFVERVVRDSPAAKAGVRKDDLIMAIGSHRVSDLDDYAAQIKRLSPDEPIDLVVRRGKRILTLRIEPEGG